MERRLILATLEHCDGDQKKAAERAIEGPYLVNGVHRVASEIQTIEN